MIYQYINLIFFFIIAFFISLVLILINTFIIKGDIYDFEKKSPYECGFQPFDMNIQKFEIKYYITGLLFLIFDLELILIIPFISVFKNLDIFSLLNFLFFFLLIIFGLIYEWKKGSLDWE